MNTYTIHLLRVVPGDPNCAPHDHLNHLVANMQRNRFTCEVCGAEYQEERAPLSPLRRIACEEAAKDIERVSRS